MEGLKIIKELEKSKSLQKPKGENEGEEIRKFKTPKQKAM